MTLADRRTGDLAQIWMETHRRKQMKPNAETIISTIDSIARQHYREGVADQTDRLAYQVGLLNAKVRELVGVLNAAMEEVDSILAEYDKKKVHLERVK
jgi:hypothetical protein